MIDIFVIAILITSAITDFLQRKIYNIAVILVFLAGIIKYYSDLIYFLFSLILAFIVIITLYYFKFFKEGDAKLLIVLGAYTGYAESVNLFLIIFVFGGIVALIYKHILKEKYLPYAPAILLGYIFWHFSDKILYFF